MSPVVIFLLFIIVMGIVAPFIMAHSRKINKAWEDAASKLGLNYIPGTFLQKRRIEGKLHGFRINIDTYTDSSGEHSRTYTRYTVNYPNSLNLGLRLTPAGILSSFAKLFGAQDIQVGEATFDNALTIKGNNEVEIQQFLTPSRRMRIQRFMRSHSNSCIDDKRIQWSRSGVVSNSALLVTTTETMVRLAWHLTGERKSDESLTKAMDLQNHGLPEEALQVITAAVARPESQPSSQSFLEEPVEEKMVLAELKYLEGNRAQAHEQFAELQELDPDDTDLKKWQDFTSREKEVLPPGDPPPVTDFTVQGFCDHLFGQHTTSFEVSRWFESSYAGHKVTWLGELQKVERNYSSFIFESNAGYKATFKIDERPSPFYGSHTVLAVVHFADELAETLKSKEGTSIKFEGTLTKADGLMRNVYLDHGELPEQA